jgi:hypothetical protein
MFDSLVNKFRDLWYGQKKIDIEGYIISKDIENNKSLVLIKIHNKVWKTTWLKNDAYNIIKPKYSLNSVFTNRV